MSHHPYRLFAAVSLCASCNTWLVKRRPNLVIRAHADRCVLCGASVTYRRSRWSEYVRLIRPGGGGHYVEILFHPDLT